MSLIPQFKTELQYIPTVKACLKLSQVDCFCLRLKGSRARQPLTAYTTKIPPNLTLTSDTEKKFKITNCRRFAITRDIQGKIH